MKPWKTLATSKSPSGAELVLQQRGQDFALRAGGVVLMDSSRYSSEGAMAEAALRGLTSPNPRVLVGGLGFGYTVRSTLELLPPTGRLIVAEISSAVVEWNRGPLAHLAREPLADPRVEVKVDDVAAVVKRANAEFDAILLDVDNGPVAMPSTSNSALYSAKGLGWFHAALRPGGRFVLWSAGPDAKFVAALKKAQFDADQRTFARDVLFVARKAGR